MQLLDVNLEQPKLKGRVLLIFKSHACELRVGRGGFARPSAKNAETAIPPLSLTHLPKQKEPLWLQLSLQVREG